MYTCTWLTSFPCLSTSYQPIESLWDSVFAENGWKTRNWGAKTEFDWLCNFDLMHLYTDGGHARKIVESVSS